VGTSVGVLLRSLSFSKIRVGKTVGFFEGVKCYGESANGGFSYNHVEFGQLHDNVTNLRLSAVGVGYCNENNFFGGSFNHSSGYPAITTWHIFLDHFPTSKLNNNRFYGPSFEDNKVAAIAAEINGANNVIFWPRMENPSNQAAYPIKFTVNSQECELLGAAFAVAATNIDDLGLGNSYETRGGAVMKSQTPATSTDAVIKAMSVATGNAKVYAACSTNGTIVAWIDGNGNGEFKNIALTNLGNYANDAAAASAGVAVGRLYHNAGALRIRLV